jgi:two-component system, sensor histidine kinase and response regulator
MIDVRRTGQGPEPAGPLMPVAQPVPAAQEGDRFFELSMDMLAVASTREGRWMRVNPAFTRILGWSEEDMLEMPFLDIVHPDDLSRSEEATALLASGQPLTRFEHRVRCHDGSYRWIAWNSVPYPEEELIYCVGRDVTERRAAEAAAHESEERLQAIIDALPVGVGVADEQGRILSLNPAGLEIHGFPSLDGMLVRLEQYRASFELRYPDGTVMPPEEWPLARALQGAYVRDFEAQIRRPDGEERVVSYSAVPVPPDLAGTSQVIFVMRDVTARVMAERALRESEARFRGTFDNAAVGVAHVALDGSWLRVNDKLCEITGYPRDQLLQRTFQDITHPEDVEADVEQARRLLGGEIGTYMMEKRYIRGSGDPVWVNLTASIVRSPDGSPDFFIAVVEDISERKEAADRLRTALAVKDEFLGLVSHELRTPMTVIFGMSRILAGGDLDGPTARETAADIAESAEVLNGLIESMLLLARLDREEAAQLRSPVLLHRAAGEVLARHRRRDPSRRYELAVLSRRTLVDVQPTWIERVIENLLSNAAKYSEPGQPVRIVVDSDGGETTLRVLDEGVGLEEAELGRVFEPFYRSPAARSSAAGAGLGLAVSRRIVELADGRIWVRRREPCGTEFGFALPLAPEEDG